jgi:uncharacterized membrane protein YsdA (DUF1294 family)
MENTYIWQTPTGHRYIILYFIIINLIGVLAMALDKYKAERSKWRIPEKTLFLITLLRRWNWNNVWNV